MYERVGTIRTLAAAGALAGSLALGGCGDSPPPPPPDLSIDCLEQPGGSIELEVDMSKPNDDQGSLTVAGFDTHQLSVSNPGDGGPLQVVMYTTLFPLGAGMTKRDIDNSAGEGAKLFGHPRTEESMPPYYVTTAIGQAGTNTITIRLTCDKDQSPPA